MKFVTVLSHHKSAGGQPLDSFWFSGQACQCNGVKLTFLWTRRLRNLWGILHAHRVVFDGVPSLVEGHGLKFYLLARLLKLSLAIYWHKTDATPLLLCVLMQFRSAIMEGLALGKPCIAFDVGERCRAARQLRYAPATGRYRPICRCRPADLPAWRGLASHPASSPPALRAELYSGCLRPAFSKAVAWWDARHKAS